MAQDQDEAAAPLNAELQASCHAAFSLSSLTRFSEKAELPQGLFHYTIGTVRFPRFRCSPGTVP